MLDLVQVSCFGVGLGDSVCLLGVRFLPNGVCAVFEASELNIISSFYECHGRCVENYFSRNLWCQSGISVSLLFLV